MKKLLAKVGPKKDPALSLVGKTVLVGSFQVRVESIVGEGGYASIYKARDLISGLVFALKHLRLNGDTEHILEVQHEAKTMNKLKGHQNILRLHATAFAGPKGMETDGFMLLDYCPTTLIEVLQGMNFICSDQLLVEVFDCVCQGIAHMHKQNPPWAHRDLKAENVLKLSEGQWVLCDFGSATTRAKVYETPLEISQEEEVIRRHTTPAYRAPEMWDLISRQLIDTKVDIWALGVLLYVLAFGKLPFQGDSKLQVLYGKYDMPAGRHPAIRSLIRELLVVNPQDRPDINQVLSRLEGLKQATGYKGPVGVNATRPQTSGPSAMSQAAPVGHSLITAGGPSLMDFPSAENSRPTTSSSSMYPSLDGVAPQFGYQGVRQLPSANETAQLDNLRIPTLATASASHEGFLPGPASLNTSTPGISSTPGTSAGEAAPPLASVRSTSGSAGKGVAPVDDGWADFGNLQAGDTRADEPGTSSVLAGQQAEEVTPSPSASIQPVRPSPSPPQRTHLSQVDQVHHPGPLPASKSHPPGTTGQPPSKLSPYAIPSYSSSSSVSGMGARSARNAEQSRPSSGDGRAVKPAEPQPTPTPNRAAPPPPRQPPSSTSSTPSASPPQRTAPHAKKDPSEGAVTRSISATGPVVGDVSAQLKQMRGVMDEEFTKMRRELQCVMDQNQAMALRVKELEEVVVHQRGCIQKLQTDLEMLGHPQATIPITLGNGMNTAAGAAWSSGAHNSPLGLNLHHRSSQGTNVTQSSLATTSLTSNDSSPVATPTTQQASTQGGAVEGIPVVRKATGVSGNDGGASGSFWTTYGSRNQGLL